MKGKNMGGVFSSKPRTYTGTIIRIAANLIEFTGNDGDVYTFDISPRNFKLLANWLGYYPDARNPKPNTKLTVQNNEVIGWE
jgi:hypothetical protein